MSMKQKLISNWNAIDFSIIWRRAKSWSAYPLLFLKPHCSSLKTRSTESLHRLRITEANTLPGTDNREIPRWFEHSDLFPLLLYLEPLVLRCCLSMTSLQQRPLLLVSTLHQTTTSQTGRACGLRDQFLAPAISSPALPEYPTCIAPDPFSKPLKIRLGSVFWRFEHVLWCLKAEIRLVAPQTRRPVPR